jgi:tetratricopeptide (TPR) repeat protein
MATGRKIALALALLLMNAAAAYAANVVALPAAALYRDADVATSASASSETALDALIAQEPGNIAALAQRGRLRMREGRMEDGQSDFDAAIALADADSSDARLVLWTYGWAQLEAGNLPDALHNWQEAERLHGGHPFWVSYSFATVLWLMDEQELAVAYYDAAVRSYPKQWGNADAVARSTLDWQPLPRAAIADVFAAWQSQQPASP